MVMGGRGRAVAGRKGAQGMTKSHHPQQCYLGYAERMMTFTTHRGGLSTVGCRGVEGGGRRAEEFQLMFTVCDHQVSNLCHHL